MPWGEHQRHLGLMVGHKTLIEKLIPSLWLWILRMFAWTSQSLQLTSAASRLP